MWCKSDWVEWWTDTVWSHRWVSARKNVTPVLTHWSYVFLALTHRHDDMVSFLQHTQNGYLQAQPWGGGLENQSCIEMPDSKQEYPDSGYDRQEAPLSACQNHCLVQVGTVWYGFQWLILFFSWSVCHFYRKKQSTNNQIFHFGPTRPFSLIHKHDFDVTGWYHGCDIIIDHYEHSHTFLQNIHSWPFSWDMGQVSLLNSKPNLCTTLVIVVLYTIWWS